MKNRNQLSRYLQSKSPSLSALARSPFKEKSPSMGLGSLSAGALPTLPTTPGARFYFVFRLSKSYIFSEKLRKGRGIYSPYIVFVSDCFYIPRASSYDSPRSL